MRAARARGSLARRTARVAPAVGLEPTTKRLTAARSTTELRRSEGPPGGGLRAEGRRQDSTGPVGSCLVGACARTFRPVRLVAGGGRISGPAGAVVGGGTWHS